MNFFSKAGTYALSALGVNMARPSYNAALPIVRETTSQIEKLFPSYLGKSQKDERLLKIECVNDGATAIGAVADWDYISLSFYPGSLTSTEASSYAAKLAELTGLKVSSTYSSLITLEGPKIMVHYEGQSAAEDVECVEMNKAAPAKCKEILDKCNFNADEIRDLLNEITRAEKASRGDLVTEHETRAMESKTGERGVATTPRPTDGPNRQ